ncbi:hypothetical protein Golax_018214 [Gossypium laxum]|uniref:Uncharacterized protein n=1 Tax=Gossypium laxum TaxID=34288 RepID=A0A7J8Z3Y2_9ROSI|nr:hypothetical protein [Gossypium laxum]
MGRASGNAIRHRLPYINFSSEVNSDGVDVVEIHQYSDLPIIPSSNPSELNLHNHFLHLILTWILRPISEHVILRAIDYWWFDCFQTNRHLDVALIMFSNITKVLGKELTTFVTLPFGTYPSYIFKRLKLPTQVDPPLSIRQPLGVGLLGHLLYKKDICLGVW